MDFANIQKKIRSKFNMGKLKCKLFGCNLRRVAYLNPYYDVWVCVNCGAVVKARKKGYYEGN